MANEKRICVEPTAELATDLVGNLVKTIVCECVAQRGTCHLALAGGTTPHGLYQRLANSAVGGEVPWTDVEVFFGDERDVPLDHVESNYNMAQRTLLDHVPIEPGRVHPIRGDAENLQAAAAEYEQTIRRIVPPGSDGIPRMDLVLLGMGGDGHTASLFPGTTALKEKKALVVAHFVPVLSRTRITFTYPLLNAARNIILLVTGDDKAEAVSTLLGNDSSKRQLLPAAGINPDGLLVMVFDAAASRRAAT